MQKYIKESISVNELPEAVNQLTKPLKTLNVRGNADLLKSGKRVSIVGARKFTPYGREVTQKIATDLARAGVTIVSGLAIGVDSIAHRACIEAGGKTVAVLPSGFDNIYPSSHAQLAKQIVANGGLLVSEYENNHRPKKYEFIERNRIIASLCDILIVTEAAEASGSLHTASFALDLGIQIMAVPGNITSPYSTGTNKLIQKGAEPLLDTTQILQMLEIEQDDKLSYIPENEIEEIILNSLSTPKSDQELIQSTKLELTTLSTYLTLLEIKDIVIIESGIWRIK